MTMPNLLKNLRIPLIGSPLFIISNPDLVIAQCKAGIVGSFPALNAREKDGDGPGRTDQNALSEGYTRYSGLRQRRLAN